MRSEEETLTFRHKTDSFVSLAIVSAHTEENSSKGRSSDSGIKQTIRPKPFLLAGGGPA